MINKDKIITDNFTHEGKLYSLTKVRVLVRQEPAFLLPIEKLEWVLKYDKPNPERVRLAKHRYPLLVTKDVRTGRYTVVDGLHRLERYRRMGIKVIPVKLVSQDVLDKTRIS